ncbi:hypothetical protein SAMN05660841_01692 [Sphingobacterium nematocida]|uniref:Uncharacterized protein n=1 Tax=Sphingobacterium nematocida TaxID=1513896 RepID=A0A1T5CZQ6_9SPHI|nr:hypothetical protein [Sphingobacterium nematocida]SKB64998.1 hypothetical protein SAMN05660841_01692 [Sphingobacterium nematocida]
MAKSRDNIVMQGASGRIGRNLVFRQRGDQTIISKTPRIPTDRVMTAKQVAVQYKFYDATQYAKSVMLDDDLKAEYKRKANVNQSAYNVAFKDYFTDPEIRRVDDRAYEGEVGDKISFHVKDVMVLRSLSVEILDSQGDVLESAAAVLKDRSDSEWVYTATVQNPDFLDSKYRVTMVDKPNKVVTETRDFGEYQG